MKRKRSRSYEHVSEKQKPRSMKNQSVKHHYLPRHYLKGFINQDESFYVYDKEKDKIFCTYPNVSFFEKNLNTIPLPNGGSSDFLEDIYTSVENTSWPSLDRIRNSTRETNIEPLDKMHVLFFLYFMYWRLPNRLTITEQLANEAFLKEGAFDFISIKNMGGLEPQEVADLIKCSQSFKKIFRSIIPFAPFYKDTKWNEQLHQWRFLYTQNKENWFMVGDNPIITRTNNIQDPVGCLDEFIFPISGNILLVNKKQALASSQPPDFILQYCFSVIERSTRFIACPNQGFLITMIAAYKDLEPKKQSKTHSDELFKMID